MLCCEIQSPTKSYLKKDKKENRNWKKIMQGHYYPKSKVGPWVSLERKIFILILTSYCMPVIKELKDLDWTAEELNHVQKRRQKENK